MTLTEILSQYRAGERELPTYAELLAIDAQINALTEQAEQLTERVVELGGVNVE